ncbi:MAG: hypothetical protein HYR58_08230 [Acidobacteria bacterium]|nr:hypothetical protein [Acidobacteriota bacterium]
MNPLARLILRAKHWQIFIMLSSPLMLAMPIMAYHFRNTFPLPDGIGSYEITIAFLFFLSMWCDLAWLWATGAFLNSIALPALKMKTIFFRFSLLYTLVYYSVDWMAFHTADPEVSIKIFPLHAFALFCGFYLLSFVSKSLVVAETRKPVGFLDYAGPFFLIWFFPIGVWVIQPRINRLYAESLSPAEEIRLESQL